MPERMALLRFHLSRCLAHSGAGGLLIASLVIGGLLAVPTTCACGADYPHEHSLFELPGHHHDGHRAADSASAGERVDGPTVTTSAADGSASSEVAVVTYSVGEARDDRPAVILSVNLLADELRDGPDTPPPRG